MNHQCEEKCIKTRWPKPPSKIKSPNPNNTILANPINLGVTQAGIGNGVCLLATGPYISSSRVNDPCLLLAREPLPPPCFRGGHECSNKSFGDSMMAEVVIFVCLSIAVVGNNTDDEVLRRLVGGDGESFLDEKFLPTIFN